MAAAAAAVAAAAAAAAVAVAAAAAAAARASGACASGAWAAAAVRAARRRWAAPPSRRAGRSSAHGATQPTAGREGRQAGVVREEMVRAGDGRRECQGERRGRRAGGGGGGGEGHASGGACEGRLMARWGVCMKRAGGVRGNRARQGARAWPAVSSRRSCHVSSTGAPGGGGSCPAGSLELKRGQGRRLRPGSRLHRSLPLGPGRLVGCS